MRWRGLTLGWQPWPSDCSDAVCRAPPPVPSPRRPRQVNPALPAFPGFPLGRNPSSVVRDFYCLSWSAHKAFPRYLQDNFFIHRTSTVYPLCTAAFHRAIHSLIHRLCGWDDQANAVFTRQLLGLTQFPNGQWLTCQPTPTMTKRDVTTPLAWSVDDR
jgi:hypothetical protein